MGYSLDLRERIIQSWYNGYRPEWIAAEFNVGHSTVKRYITRYKRLGHVRATRQRPRQGRFNAEQLSLLEQQVRDHADATVDEHSQLWNDSQALPASCSTIGLTMLKGGWTLKKTFGVQECNEADRALFRNVVSRWPAKNIMVVEKRYPSGHDAAVCPCPLWTTRLCHH